MTDCWNPAQYEKFRNEREQPFFDLLALVEPARSMRVVDLGCGTGKQTRALHERLRAAETVGIDQSPAMLKDAPSGVAGLSFREATIEAFAGDGEWDVVFSNAAFHWTERHGELVPRLARALKPDGQLAFQVPAMHHAVTHTAAHELTSIEPFRSAFAGWSRPQPVLTPDEYARLLFDSGFAAQHVRLVVYPHVLDGPEAVLEWMKGTLVAEYQRHLPVDLRAAFVDAYRERLLGSLPHRSPFFFPFNRILCWARKGSAGVGG